MSAARVTPTRMSAAHVTPIRALAANAEVTA